MCEMFVVDKWRIVGFYTQKQINREAYYADIRDKLKWNAPRIYEQGFTLDIKQD
jgi:hypothetical protein